LAADEIINVMRSSLWSLLALGCCGAAVAAVVVGVVMLARRRG
jgi:hypothetical protein